MGSKMDSGSRPQNLYQYWCFYLFSLVVPASLCEHDLATLPSICAFWYRVFCELLNSCYDLDHKVVSPQKSDRTGDCLHWPIFRWSDPYPFICVAGGFSWIHRCDPHTGCCLCRRCCTSNLDMGALRSRIDGIEYRWQD